MARVLVVEDVEAVRNAIVAVLTRLGGHEVVSAGDGAAGLALLAAGPVDVVVTDIWMPGGDGIAFLQEAKTRHPGLPVIVVTGGGPKFPPIELSVSVVESHGADAVLIKPFEDDELLDAVRQFSRARR
jgi:CheY-like chemotaxis protein